MDSVVEPPVTVIAKIIECPDSPAGLNHMCFHFQVRRTSFDRSREFLAGCFITTTAQRQGHGLLEFLDVGVQFANRHGGIVLGHTVNSFGFWFQRVGALLCFSPAFAMGCSPDKLWHETCG